MDKEQIDTRIAEIETAMYEADFWNDKSRAQAMIAELQELKIKREGGSEFDRGAALITLYAGAGGDDAEDFVAMLLAMYDGYIAKRGWERTLLDSSENDRGGYRSVFIQISGKNAYGTLKHESGVHRLVRLSPFNAKNLRQTSFAMVEVIPKIEKGQLPELNPNDLKIELSKAGGPGGQNVNKRETAVRIVHIPTGIAVTAATERSQEQNKDRAFRLLEAKLYAKQQEEEEARIAGMQVSKTTDNEWGSQMRSYVLHPYKLVKDHRTGVETSQVEKVLSGDIELFLQKGDIK